MFNSQVHRSLWLALAAAGVLSFAGCSNTATNGAASTAKKADAPRPVAAAKAVQPTATVTVPKGTAISATVDQTLATNKNHVGDTFAASLATPIKVGGKTVIPKGAHVTGRIVTLKKHELKVTLASVVIRGKSYPLETNSIAGPKSQAKSNAKDTKKAKANKDVTRLNARSHLTFKLAKPVAIPVKG